MRRATVADAAEIARINVEGWQAGYRGLLPETFLNSLRAVDRVDRVAGWITAAPPGAVFVAVDPDGAIGAFAGALAAPSETGRPVGELGSLYADPRRRGTGAGAAAHDAALDHLRAHGFTRAIVWVLRTNATGRLFYERHRWAPDGVVREDVTGGMPTTAVRYSIDLGAPAPGQSSMT